MTIPGATPISRTCENHVIRKFDQADMSTFRKLSARDLLPSGLTAEELQVEQVLDGFGKPIHGGDEIHFCSVCNNVAHREDIFQCQCCFIIACKTHAKVLMPASPLAVPPLPGNKPAPILPESAPDSAAAPAVPAQEIAQGICGECAKKIFWKNLMLAPLRFILSPLKAMFTDTGTSGEPGKPTSGTAVPCIILPFLIFPLFFSSPRQGAFPAFSPHFFNIHDSPTEVIATMSNHSQTVPRLADAKAVLEEAVKRGYDRRLGTAYFVHCRDLDIGIKMGKVDVRALTSLLEYFQIEDTMSPTADFHKPFLPDPDPAVISVGDMQSFETLGSGPVKYGQDEQPLQWRGFGRFGTGKTSFGYSVVHENIGHGLSCVIIDSKAVQFDTLLTLFPGKVIKLKVGRDRIINAWKYPDLANSMFCKMTDRHDSQTILDMGGFQLRNPAAGKKAEPVTFARLFTLLPKVRPPYGFPNIKDDLRQSLLAVFLEMYNNPLFASIDCEQGLDFAELIKHGISVIIDTSEIAGTQLEDLFVTILLLNIREDVRHDPVLRARRGHLILFLVDEASSIAASTKTFTFTRGLHPFCQIVSLCRGSGISVFLCYHSPSSVPEILHSSYFMVCAGLVNGADIFAVKKAMFLNEEQARALTQLPVGHGVMIIAGRCPTPFIVKWPDFPAVAAPTEAAIAASNAAILKTLPAIIPDTCRLDRLFAMPSASSGTVTSSIPAADLEYLLKHIEMEPFLNLTDRCKALKFPSGATMTYKLLGPILEDMRTKKWIDRLNIQMSIVGGPGEYWFLLADTRIRLFGSSGLMRGGSGPAHNLLERFVHRILTGHGLVAEMEAWI